MDEEMGTLRDRLLTGTEVLCGAFLNLPSPALTEMLGVAGFDFAILDMEHGAFNPERTEDCLRAAAAVGMSCMVRLGELNPHVVQLVLDMGADGIQVPEVETAEEATRAVTLSHFPPNGTRGYGSTTRAARYGTVERNRVLREADQRTTVCVQIESRKGVENISEIVSTSGMDVVFIGTSDLSLSFGVDSPKHPDIVCLVDKMVPTITKAGKVAGIFLSDWSQAPRLMELGVRYFAVSAALLVKDAFCQRVEKFAALKERPLIARPR
ncbi:MAG: aldolase/citrate lyase family protein [Candidatus Korobacteraceae bacterium]